MKINAVHLETYCCDWRKPGAIRTGHLYKKSESNRAFNKRWFLLRDNLLFYFSHKKPSDPTPLGLIILEGCCIDRVDTLTFRLSFPGSGARSYLLMAKTEDEVDGWIEALGVAGFDSMQYAIKELEKQLDELVRHGGGRTSTTAGGDPNNPPAAAADEPLLLLLPSASSSSRAAERKASESAESHSSAETRRDRSPVDVTATLDANRVLRIFVEMHRQYGDFIESKTKERSKRE